MLLSTMKDLIPAERIQQSTQKPGQLGNYGDYIVFPHTEDEIASILTHAAAHALTIIPEGAGTKRGYGGTREKADILLSLKQYQGVVEYSEGDMTMTVRAGTTLKEIQQFLKPYNQMLPLDPSWPSHSTLGGILSANDSGPKRLRYGSARDLVIGTRVIYPNGRVIRTGGKVVKNVAGYDMNKLMIGAMGTLGVLTDITVKLRPLPKYQSLVLLSFEAVNMIRPFATQLLDSTLEPVSLELLNSSISEKCIEKKQPTLAIALEDVEKAVRYQEDWITTHLPSGVSMSILRGEEAEDWWAQFAVLAPIGAAEDDMDVALKIGTKNLEVLEIIEEAERIATHTNTVIQSHGGLGHGLTKIYVKGSHEALGNFVQQIRKQAEQKGGYAFLQHGSIWLRQQVDVWGTKPAYFPLLEGIKKTIDPGRVLNPNRFIGGI